MIKKRTDVWVPRTRQTLEPETVRIMRTVLGSIPPLPISVLKVIEMASDMDIGAKELAEVALTDPALTSKILTLVNSSYYALNRRIDDMRVAIVLIGFNAVRNLAIQNRFLEILETSEHDYYNREQLWLHSYLVSVCAEMLVGDDDPKRLGTMMTMGILHDIGKFAFFTIARTMQKKGTAPKGYGDTLPGTNHLQREERFLGVNHAIIGGMLARKWNLSDRISAVLEHHHAPSFYGVRQVPAEFASDIATICIADLVVNLYSGADLTLPEPHPIFFELAGLTPPLSALLTPTFIARLDHAKSFVESLR